MADKAKPQGDTAKKAAASEDPTIRRGQNVPEYPEGTHPPLPVEEADDAAVNQEFAENPDKPNDSSIAQVEVVPEPEKPKE